MLREKFAVVMKGNAATRQKEDWARLPDSLLLAVGLKVMVTHNIDTSWQVANGAQGVIMKILLDP